MRLRPSHYWIAVTLLPVLLVAFHPQISPAVHNFGDGLFRPVLSLASGVAYTAANIRDGLQHAWQSFQDQSRDEEEIAGLKRRIEDLEEMRRENERLRKLLSFKETFTTKPLAARVIGWDISPWRRLMILDHGQKEGIQKDMSVVVSEGLVGRVFEAGAHTSRVLLVLDPESRVSVLTSESRAQGIAAGNGSDQLSMEYLEPDSNVALGETLLTSGATGLFPKGIPVGKIHALAKSADGLHLSAEVKPAVSFSKIEEVLCLELSPAA